MISNEALIVVIFSAISTAIGYWIREWQNRFRPFMSIVSFEGDNFLRSTKIKLDSDIAEKTEKTFFIGNLSEITTLGNIKDAKDKANIILETVPETIKNIDNFIETLGKKDETKLAIFRSLENLFRSGDIDLFILKLLQQGEIHIPKTPRDEETYVYDLSEVTYNGGCYCLTYESKTLFIGTDFNKQSHYKGFFTPLVTILRVLDKENIINAFGIIKNKLISEVAVGNVILSKLQDILNSNSLWEVELFIANLRSTPLLLENTANIYVKDKTGATFCEKCKLSIREKNDAGKTIQQPSNYPLIIPNGGSVTISYFTEKSQKEMDCGDDFRSAFIKKQAEAWLELSMSGVGLIKKRIYKTDKKKFVEQNID